MTDGVPGRLMVIVRPVGADDVAILMDGRKLDTDELPGARAFLGTWREQARVVSSAGMTIAVADDATMVEAHTVERDEDGRLEPVAIWYSINTVATEALREASEFVQSCGRSFDEQVMQSGLATATRTTHLQRKFHSGGRFLGLLRRLLDRLMGRQSHEKRARA